MHHFEVIILGCTGGPLESNASSYLLYSPQKKEAIALDAGTLLHGLQVAYEKGSLEDFSLEDPTFQPVAAFLRRYIKAYLISHGHLDHLAGMVFASQIDTTKPLLANDITIDFIRDHIFNNKIWVNQGSEGERALNLYTYERLSEGERREIKGTSFSVEVFPLNHGKSCPSSAFLVDSEGHYVLYFGDSSSDFVEAKKHNSVIWHKIAPLLKQNKLRAIFLECSYPQSKVEHPLYGHLNPELLTKELTHLSQIAQTPLQGLKVIVTHRKEDMKNGSSPLEKIAQDLLSHNPLKIHYHFPKQGEKILL